MIPALSRIKKTVLAVLFVCLALPCPKAHASDALVLVSVPWRKPPVLQEIYRPLIQLLGEELGRPVRFFVAGDYEELGKRLHSGAADLGIFGGSAYVEAKARYPEIRYLATCMQPTAFYNSLIITLKSTPARSLPDLRGKSFGFTDKDSTSGYLYPLLMLTAENIHPGTDFSITYFLETHDKVYDAVAKGTIDAGGVSRTALKKAVAGNGDIFRILAESDPIPRNAVAAGGHLPEAAFSRISDILAAAADSRAFRQSDSILKGFSIRSDAFYDIVRRAKQLKE